MLPSGHAAGLPEPQLLDADLALANQFQTVCARSYTNSDVVTMLGYSIGLHPPLDPTWQAASAKPSGYRAYALLKVNVQAVWLLKVLLWFTSDHQRP